LEVAPIGAEPAGRIEEKLLLTCPAESGPFRMTLSSDEREENEDSKEPVQQLAEPEDPGGG